MRVSIIAVLVFGFWNMSYADDLLISGTHHLVFLDWYNQPIVTSVGSTPTVTVLSSDILLEAGNPESLIEQVVVWGVTRENPCGYFWVVSIGSPVRLPFDGGEVQIFVPEAGDVTDNSGSAQVRIGSRIFSVNGRTNAVPISASNAAHIDIPEGLTSEFIVSSSNISLGSPSVLLDKVIVFDSGSQSSTGWLYDICLGDSPIVIPPTSSTRTIWGFIVDHVLYSDNTGGAVLQIESWNVVQTEGAAWGEIKAMYR